MGVIAHRVALHGIRLQRQSRVQIIQPARPGVKMPCVNIRLLPASAFTFSRAAAIWALVRNQSSGTSDGEELTLAFGFRRRQIFVAGDDLHRHRRAR